MSPTSILQKPIPDPTMHPKRTIATIPHLKHIQSHQTILHPMLLSYLTSRYPKRITLSQSVRTPLETKFR